MSDDTYEDKEDAKGQHTGRMTTESLGAVDKEKENGPPGKERASEGDASSNVTSGKESTDVTSLPPPAELRLGHMRFIPPGGKQFPPLDFARGQAYQESMRQTDFGDTAIKQIAKLALFFKEKLPGEQQSGESVADAAIRLLGHYTHE